MKNEVEPIEKNSNETYQEFWEDPAQEQEPQHTDWRVINSEEKWNRLYS